MITNICNELTQYDSVFVNKTVIIKRLKLIRCTAISALEVDVFIK